MSRSPSGAACSIRVWRTLLDLNEIRPCFDDLPLVIVEDSNLNARMWGERTPDAP